MYKLDAFRFSQVGVVSYGSECPSHGVYARVTEVKHWIQYIAQGAMDTSCNHKIPHRPGSRQELILWLVLVLIICFYSQDYW